MTTENAIAYTKQLLGHYPFTYCPTLAAKTSNHTPHKGDIVLFYSAGDYCHTGMVYKTDSTYFYTIEGNTTGGSSNGVIISNGGGVALKSYRTASYSASKFYRMDFSILVKAGFFASADAAIDAIIATEKAEVGYLEKNNASSLDSKTGGSVGNGNFTKYWRDIKSSWQGQPWCAIFQTWCIQKTLEAVGATTSVSATTAASTKTSTAAATTTTIATTAKTTAATATTKTTYDNVKAVLKTYCTPKKWTNGSTSEVVYADSAKKTKIGTLDPRDGAALIGRQGSMYIVAYEVDDGSNYKVGFVDYAGGSSIASNTVKSWKNGSTEENVFCDTKMQSKIGSCNAYETTSCLGTLNGKWIVLYKVDNTSYYKVGVTEYNGQL